MKTKRIISPLKWLTTLKTLSGPRDSSSGTSNAKNLTDKYRSEQLSRLKSMSKEEEAKIRCDKCGEYFHTASEYKNSGQMCYSRLNYGHKKDCPH